MVVCISEMAFILGMSCKTLRRWEGSGSLIPDFRSLGGHRRYNVNRVLKLFGVNVDSKALKERIDIVYTRVSSVGQKPDLDRQIERMTDYVKEISPLCHFISDIGSGLNYNKKGLLDLIRLIASGNVARVFVAHRDRLIRFGYELIEYFAMLFNTKIYYVDDSKLSDAEEMTNDILSIITVFSARIHGKRSHKNKKMAKIITDKVSEISIL